MMTMYGHWRSQAALRLRIAFALKGIAWSETPIDILGGGQFEPGYVALNPQAMVPAVEDPDGGAPLTQSLAVMEWLEERHPTPPLLPADPRGRARVRALSLIMAADTHPLVVPGVRARLAQQFGADEAAIGAWSQFFMARGLRAVEAHLARDAVPGAYCHGDAPGMADICLYGLLAGYAQRNGSLAEMPTVARIGALLEADPRFAAAHPLRQPGAPAPGR